MLKKTIAVSVAGLGAAVTSVATAGAACATITVSPSTGFGGSTVVIAGHQSTVVGFDAPVLDARCALPWYGSSVIGGSTPIGQMNVTCDDIKAEVQQLQDHSTDAVIAG